MATLRVVVFLFCIRTQVNSFTQTCRGLRSSESSYSTKVFDSFRIFDDDEDDHAVATFEWESGVQEMLAAWAEQSGIHFSKHLTIREGIFVTSEEGQQGDSVLEVPRSMILSSRYYEKTSLKDWVEDLVGKADGALCLLMIRLLEEMSKQESSNWYPWLQSLPKKFKTGVFWDDVERSHVQQMAPEALQIHMDQWDLCSHVVQLLQYGFFEDEGGTFSPSFRPWLEGQEDLEFTLKRVFSIVCARSWKSSNGRQLKIVPFAERLGRDKGSGNIRPFIRGDPESALQVVLTQGVLANEKLCMPCTMGDNLARPLVNCGYVDYSTPYMGAHVLTESLVDQMFDWPMVDVQELVVSTRNGAVSGETWKLFLYTVLHQYDQPLLQSIKLAEENELLESDLSVDTLLEEAMQKWEGVVATSAKQHFQSVLDSQFPPLFFSQEDLEGHEHLRLIMEFNLYMRTTVMKVLRHIDEISNQDTASRLSYSLQQ
ncbi:unnamed protein product [Cylindrotheca closterium]|uniref:Rubisco LSMT substrate-binding domain-containing protein n=1 Tax=Cylindrotheca closterium TaxID=2856 RepID=A0AAD2CEB1_9STRA|nr:unnamed protein product [Cylindrotheca closterium]